MGEVDIKKELENNAVVEPKRVDASAKWISAAKWALALSLTGSHQELDAICRNETSDNILHRTRDAAHTLQEVLLGHHDDAIDEELNKREVAHDRWWHSLLRVVEGMEKDICVLIICIAVL
jgi:ATP-binding cassette subfamily C (CFTR/MRP) protein 1